MTAFLKDMINFKKTRTLPEAALFYVFYTSIFFAVSLVLGI